MRFRHLLAGITLSAPLPAWAGVEVSSTGISYATIGEAITNASPGDTLFVEAGVYAETFVIDKDLTILGDGRDLVTITGAAPAGVVVEVETLVTAHIEGVTITSTDIGGIEAKGLGLTIIGSRFSGTTAGLGGAIYAISGGGDTLTLTDVLFEGTSASVNGGALYTANVDVSCTDCVFTGAAATDGGAIWSSGGSLTLTGGSCEGNTASSDGGAVYVTGAALTIDGTDFVGNTATLDGGALALVNPSALDIVGASFRGNDAYSGGAIDGTTTVTGYVRNNAFVENNATTGGGLHLAGTGTWTLENLAVLGNTSPFAGAVRFVSTSGTVRNSLFAHNDGVAIETSFMDPVVEYNAFYTNTLNEISGGGTLDTGNLIGVDPQLTLYSLNGADDDQLWPTPYSPLIDAGHPDGAYADPDGSRADIGLFGGPDSAPERHLTDVDGDGVSLMGDCDDMSAVSYPGADEICDTLDNDCDQVIDDDPIDSQDWYPDNDQDGFGSDAPGVAITACDPPLGYVADYRDCDDGDDTINPDATETCGPEDLDCDGEPEKGADGAIAWYPDMDLDGYGDDLQEVWSCQGFDAMWIPAPGDCNDGDPNVHPMATDVCDGTDDNCSGDETDALGAVAWYADGDGDGHGAVDALAVVACDAPPAYVVVADDCNDSEALVYPGSPEVCDGLDNDCNNVVDDGGTPVTWWPDEDGDGYGGDGLDIESYCAPGPSWIHEGGDCDDDNADAYVGAPEICDGADNDCDDAVDDADEDVLGTEAWIDFDGDGFGDGDPTIVCSLDGYATQDGDCNDLDPEMNPDATDIAGNDLDEDCDGRALDPDAGTVVPPSDPGGCGCTHTTPSFGWAVPIVALGLIRRRRM